MAKRILIGWNWLYVLGVMFIGLFQIDINAEIIGGDNPWQNDKRSYRPYPILFLHGFAGGSNYTWNPDPNAKDQATEQKKPTAVLDKYFNKYFRVNLALKREGYSFTQFPYLETIEFFDSKLTDTEQTIDRNSSVDTYKGGIRGDHYVVFGKIGKDGYFRRNEGDPGWGDKVSYALRGQPIHDLSKYLYDDSPEVGGGPVLKNYLPPNATSFKALLVCHSMGGLSAREYVTNSKYSNSKDNVAGIVTVGTPHLGSPLATAANAVSLVQFIPFKSKIAWATVAVIMEGLDVNLEWFSKIDPDGDAVNDMDPVTLLFFGNGYLGELANRSYPSNVPVRVISSRFTPGGMQLGLALQEYISKLIEEGKPKGIIKEILEEALGLVIVENITSNAVGDGVVFLYSQQGIKGSSERVFKLDKPIKGGDNKVIEPEVEIRGFHADEAIPAASETDDEASALLKLIDYTKPRLEIAKPQEGFVWESGATVTLEGKVYDEYLPADSSINIELYKAGDNFNPIFSEVRKPDPITGYTPLKPTTLWNPNNSSSPVAEFQEDVMLPSGTNPEATYTIKLTVLNPAGISSEPKQVTEKTWYMYTVGSNSGIGNAWCFDVPTSFTDGKSAVVSEFILTERELLSGTIPIRTQGLGITGQGNNFYASFADNTIRKYNIYGESEDTPDGKRYWEVSIRPDGIDYDGWLWVASGLTGKNYRLNSNGTIEGIYDAGSNFTPYAVLRNVNSEIWFGGAQGTMVTDITPSPSTLEYEKVDTIGNITGLGYRPTNLEGKSEPMFYAASNGTVYELKRISMPKGFDEWDRMIKEEIKTRYEAANLPVPVLEGIVSYRQAIEGLIKRAWNDEGNKPWNQTGGFPVLYQKAMGIDLTGPGRDRWKNNTGYVYQSDIDEVTNTLNQLTRFVFYLGYTTPSVMQMMRGGTRTVTRWGGPITIEERCENSRINWGDLLECREHYAYTSGDVEGQGDGRCYDRSRPWGTMVGTWHGDIGYIIMPGGGWAGYTYESNSGITVNVEGPSGGSAIFQNIPERIFQIAKVDGHIKLRGYSFRWHNSPELPYPIEFSGALNGTFSGDFRWEGDIAISSPVNTIEAEVEGLTEYLGCPATTGGWGTKVSWWLEQVDNNNTLRVKTTLLSPAIQEENVEWDIIRQFTLSQDMTNDLGIGDRFQIRLKPGYPSSMDVGKTSQLEAHGKEPLAWVTSDENVGKVDSNGLFTAVCNGTCTVTVTDALGNMATSGAIIVQ